MTRAVESTVSRESEANVMLVFFACVFQRVKMCQVALTLKSPPPSLEARFVSCGGCGNNRFSIPSPFPSAVLPPDDSGTL